MITTTIRLIKILIKIRRGSRNIYQEIVASDEVIEKHEHPLLNNESNDELPFE